MTIAKYKTCQERGQDDNAKYKTCQERGQDDNCKGSNDLDSCVS